MNQEQEKRMIFECNNDEFEYRLYKEKLNDSLLALSRRTGYSLTDLEALQRVAKSSNSQDNYWDKTEHYHNEP